MTRSIIAGTLVGLLLLGLFVVRGQTQTPGVASPENVKKFMRVKLKHSQNVLEGLTLEDYDKIAKDSQAISLLSLASSWQVLQTPQYVQHSADFRRSVDRVTKSAKNKNLDGATLAYVEMTVKCVNCHKYVRQVRVAKLDTFKLPQDNEILLTHRKATP